MMIENECLFFSSLLCLKEALNGLIFWLVILTKTFLKIVADLGHKIALNFFTRQTLVSRHLKFGVATPIAVGTKGAWEALAVTTHPCQCRNQDDKPLVSTTSSFGLWVTTSRVLNHDFKAQCCDTHALCYDLHNRLLPSWILVKFTSSRW